MGHDYWMYRGDEAYMKTLLPAYRGVLSWYEQWLKRDHSLGMYRIGSLPTGLPVSSRASLYVKRMGILLFRTWCIS